MRNLLLFIFILSISFTKAQEAAIFEGELLVQTIKGDNAINEIVKDLSQYDVEIISRISPIMDIYHLRFDIQTINQEAMLREVGLHSKILIVQNNHKTQLRDTTPNDTEFNNQWQYINNGGSGGVADADIDAELAWDITTGGMTPNGDEIVICVIDDGLNPNHPDFAGNIWSNTLETPNGIDDDGNGYIDDIDGWNADDNNDNINNTGLSHGTAVACIVGCQGNNNNGVTGVNWDVKLMIVNGGGGEAQALAAYAYPHAMRKLYNETDGAKGAFVVATNASWGVDGGQAANAPLWCSFYDSLGAIGILNAGATINDNQNVDTYGDLPTGCSSDYLITVTNLWRDDNKVTGAGYGATTIDIGAHGQDTWTAAQFGTGYDGFGGTSGATPHVAGAIGLLYSAPCSSFATLYETDPA
ncbi:MAG: S8 family serine peptidase, partial [Chitinophagales bacterium]